MEFCDGCRQPLKEVALISHHINPRATRRYCKKCANRKTNNAVDWRACRSRFFSQAPSSVYNGNAPIGTSHNDLRKLSSAEESCLTEVWRDRKLKKHFGTFSKFLDFALSYGYVARSQNYVNSVKKDIKRHLELERENPGIFG